LHVSSTSTGKAAHAAYSPFERFKAEKTLKKVEKMLFFKRESRAALLFANRKLLIV
jgi:hypothetical protein